MGANCNKLLLDVAGRPVLAWTLDSACAADSIDWIGVVGQPYDKPAIKPLIEDCSKAIKWIDGGKTRQESVMRGISALPSNAKHVLIHDGARCLVEPRFIDECAKSVLRGEAIVAATPVIDTIKRVNDEGLISGTPNRSELWAAQTPQGFSVPDLKKAHSEAIKKQWTVTDDASLYERLGWPVRIMKSEPSNLKVTTPFDLLIAEALIASRESV